ncbi:hypothetical protein JX265_012402 [Neoarthrinium moseri]|uniref:NAD-dependent epimerase/dehydratase domain-containing protein n=1 Tax=Neoarthrinium moseri TaxID=1658444 RepID=A0A9Q0AJN9_9PEZI|nr:uncharacterized protein JN550_013671 [Neoarthrinium moseri]KAI1851516.1 hypothetical protein JX266_002978 [Neoarthrinium moseri]KAI1855047.1 hypothetical protein JX265_012402 [Neoarthrinium moseri]KAI1856731.1 hypothetical protein JN550_013671 [Neoarthrinium moseri]
MLSYATTPQEVFPSGPHFSKTGKSRSATVYIGGKPPYRDGPIIFPAGRHRRNIIAIAVLARSLSPCSACLSVIGVIDMRPSSVSYQLAAFLIAAARRNTPLSLPSATIPTATLYFIKTFKSSLAMSHNILITGASGYLGGTLLNRLGEANLPPYGKLFALIRTDDQAEKAKKLYGAEPLRFDAYNEDAVLEALRSHHITVVYHLIDPRTEVSQLAFIKALGEVKKQTGSEVHFLHTTGAKIFSSHADAPTDRPLLDTDPELYHIQKSQKPSNEFFQAAVATNNLVIEQAEVHGVQAYIFAPCIVYGQGEGFGNVISIQTVAVVRAAKGAGRVYRTDQGQPTWPVCHVYDNTTLYISLLRAILNGAKPDHGRNGYYLASSGSVVWDDLYSAIAKSLKQRGVIGDDTVATADKAALEEMGKALGCPASFVPIMVGGKCTFVAERANKKLGWQAKYSPEHVLENADAEVELILKNLK